MLFYIFGGSLLVWWIQDVVRRWLFPQKPLDLASLGEWAVVAGAIDGVGKAFAEQLAKLGYNIVIISRNSEEFNAVVREISSKYSVSVKAMQAEFSLLDEAMYAQVEKEVSNVDVGVLVNNVDLGYAHPEYFHELESHQKYAFQGIVNCNMTSIVRMCRYVLPGMVARRKGLIINVSTGLSDLPTPFLSLYGASKAFVSKLSEDLGKEYEQHGVHVHCLKKGVVAVGESSWMIPSPGMYVESALLDVASHGPRSSAGYTAHTVTHGIMTTFCSLFPTFARKKLLELGLTKRNQLRGVCKSCSQ